MSAHEEERIKQLLRQALPPVGAVSGPASELSPEPVPSIDLWPALLRRLDQKPTAQSQPVPSWLAWVRHGSSWFDWALLAGVAAMTAAFPALIPLFLYYL